MLEEKLGYFFFDKKILSRALTRPSYARENQETTAGQDQEAYFVVGSNLLQMVFAELLLRQGYQTRSQIRERIKELAQQEKLATLGQTLGIAYRINLSAEDRQQHLEEDPLALAETLVAILGAVYFDGGFRTAREVTLRLFQNELPESPL